MLRSPPLQKVILSIVAVLTVVAACCRYAAASPPDQFFEAKVRPLLIEHCITCHGGDKPDAGLSLESREGWAGRDVIVPHEPEKSLVIAAVRFEKSELKMPPEDSGMRRLTESEIQILEKWIADGAVDPRVSQSNSIGPRRRSKQFQITEQDKAHWAYQSLAHAPMTASAVTASTADGTLNVPTAINQRAVQIDQAVDQKLSQLGLTRNPAATPRELVRRAYFDLWGLPPEPGSVADFESNPTPQAWNDLIERLLNSPHYGERWGRYWLDWVRYAETNGYERDGIKPNAWRYRDYVIDAFNSDKPYNRFLTEQLAGDLLIQAERLNVDNQPQAWREAIIATGFFRLHVWDDEPDSSDVAEMDDLDDIMITTGAAMMGMTLGCARCHDHKFDPLSQADYYSMLDLFRDIDPYGLSKKGGGGRGTGQIERFLVSDATLQKWQADKELDIKQLESHLASASEEQKESLNQQLKQRKESQPPFEKALAINPPLIRKPTFVLARGDVHAPGSKVDPQLPELFRATHDGIVKNRLDLANWMTHPSNPLTARVLANRIWLKHFGSGIVTTPDDFGYTGIAPSNLELLDLLSTQLIESGWSIKAMHRAIMLSKTYQMSSRSMNSQSNQSEKAKSSAAELESIVSAYEVSTAAMKDPENQYFWRQNLRRLDAEALRDSILHYAGTLHPKHSGPSVYSNLSQEIRDTANPVSLSSWGKSSDDEQNCRSVFLIVKRSLKDPILESFDFANSISPVGQRPITTVAPQSLMMLNDEFVQKQSERLARRVLTTFASLDHRIMLLWSIVYQRKPSPAEYRSIEQFLASPSQSSREELTIWTSLCRALLNSNECIYID